jgi:hypothetical protein
VDLYLQFPIRLHGVVLSGAEERPYLYLNVEEGMKYDIKYYHEMDTKEFWTLDLVYRVQTFGIH